MINTDKHLSICLHQTLERKLPCNRIIQYTTFFSYHGSQTCYLHVYVGIIFIRAIEVQIAIFPEKSPQCEITLQIKIRVYLLGSLIFGTVNKILVIVKKTLTFKYGYMIVLGSSRYLWLSYSYRQSKISSLFFVFAILILLEIIQENNQTDWNGNRCVRKGRNKVHKASCIKPISVSSDHTIIFILEDTNIRLVAW